MTSFSTNILDKLDNLIVIFNNNGDLLFVNQRVKNILGYEPQQLLGKKWLQTNRQSKHELSEIKYKSLQILNSKNSIENFIVERQIKAQNGQHKWILWKFTASSDNEIVGFGQDISSRKINEQKIKEQNKIITHKNNELVASISYSKRIQNAILPELTQLKKSFYDAFVLYKPKDIVSGDFYFFFELNDLKFVAVIDCTGHGVPGALLTILANSLLKSIIREGVSDPSEILYLLDERLYNELNLNGKEKTSDGLDICLCVFDFINNKVDFAGAYRSLYLIRNNECIEFKGARFPIGFIDSIDKKFMTESISIQQNDVFYLFSDGYQDQFGGLKEKKFSIKAFRNLLLEIQYLALEEQEGYLDYVLSNWKQNIEQTDDICIMGLKC